MSYCSGSKFFKICMFDFYYMFKKVYDGSIVVRYVGFFIFGGKKNVILVFK